MATIERYQTASGSTLYRVRYRTPDRGQTDKRGFRTKRDAEAFAASVEVSKMRGEYVAPGLGKVTVGELRPAWLARQQGHMKPSGFRSYESAWRVHVESRWGTTRVADIRYTDVQAWIADLSEKLSAPMVATTYSVLARILDDAVRDRMLAANPARGVKLPPRRKGQNVYLSAVQLRALSVESGRYGSLILLLGTAGLRWGEAAALRVGDIDFLRRRVALHQNAVTVGRKVHVGSLKSGHHRTVPLSRFVVDELAATCEGKGRDELIWPSQTGGYLGPPAGNKSWLSGAVARCQEADPTFPKITAHALRHTAASLAISAGANVKVVQRMLGHYAGDLVKCVLSGGGLIESGEQSVEHFLAAELSVLGGVVALCLQRRAEFDGGLEESAGFADGFEVAVQADGSGAVAVAEHPAVHLDTELAHLGAFGLGGQCARLVVEGFNLFADGEVFVGDGAVGDAGVNEGHPHRSVPEQRGQGFEGHAAVDCLGGQRVPQPVRADVADPGGAGGFGDGPIDAALADALAVLDEQVAAAQAGGSGGEPGVEEILQLGMQRDVAVGAQFPERHVQPVRGADLHHGIDCEIEEFALAQAGAGQELHAQSDERVVGGARGLQQLGERGAVEEPGQRVIPQRQGRRETRVRGRGCRRRPIR